MTQQYWTAPYPTNPAIPARGWTPQRLVGVLVAFMVLRILVLPIPARAQSVGNFCPSGTCDIATPNYVNVYWDSSFAQWDIDVAATTADMQHQHIDDLTQALINSQYLVNNTKFGNGSLTQYSITNATFGGSLAAVGCTAAPSTLDLAHQQISNVVNCILAANPSLNNGQTILNVFVPPQSAPASSTADFCSKFSGEHDKYGTSVEATFLPTNKACSKSLSGLSFVMSHEMVESATDPLAASPTGWKDANWGSFFGQEIGDLCFPQSVSFLYGSVTKYWSDSFNGCSSGFPLSVPSITSASACGAGKNMVITLKGSFGPRPWDLAIKKFGSQTLYANLRVLHAGQTWEAGNFEGLPSDAVNLGKPDQVNLQDVNWSKDIFISGFDSNYGNTLATGAVALVDPGDSITVNIALPTSGQFLKTTVTAPSTTQVFNLAVNPVSPDPWVFVNRKADVTGSAADNGNCGIEGQTLNFSASQGTVSPSPATTSDLGTFQTSYFAPAVASTETVTATLVTNNSVTASVVVPVHPILNTIQPALGPVAGGQNAALAGDGFEAGHTVASFDAASAKVKSATLKSIQVVTPKSPLPGDGEGTVPVVATVNGLDSFWIPYQYIVPGKPYLSFRTTSCTTHYLTVTVYDKNGQPVVAPIQLTAGYQAYLSSGVWVSTLNTTSGASVQVDKGGPFTATNKNNGLSNTASFPVLPEPVCFNVRLIGTIDWTIFERTKLLIPREAVELPVGGQVGGGQRRTIWSTNEDLNNATNYVSGPSGSAREFQVSTVGAEEFRGIINGQIFLTGGSLTTESATGRQMPNILNVKFTGPAFNIARQQERGNEAARLNSELRLTFGLPQSRSNTGEFHIVHFITLHGQPAWVEDEKAQIAPYGSALTRTATHSGIYALIQVVGSANEDGPPQR